MIYKFTKYCLVAHKLSVVQYLKSIKKVSPNLATLRHWERPRGPSLSYSMAVAGPRMVLKTS